MGVVQEVVSWWAGQLRDLVPARLAQSGLHGDALIAELGPDGIAWVQRRGRRETRLAAPPAGRRPRRVLLRVPPGSVLERALTLPLATEPELDRVIAYEVDRVSPFSAAELAWTYAVERRDRAAGRLLVRIALLPLATLESAMERLRGLRLQPDAAVAPRDDGGTWQIGLQPPGPAPGRAGRRAVAALAACCALLALGSAALPFLLQDRALRREEARIARLRPLVAEADGVRRRIADRAGGSDAVAAEAARTGQALNAIATLTTLLPDDTYLTSLSLRQRVLTLAGRSASAARLIPLLTADPSIRDAAFAAPVTRTAGTKGDVFSIRAEFGS